MITEQRRANMLEIAQGAIVEELSAKMPSIAENLLDINVDPDKARTATVTLKFTTDQRREVVRVEATTKVSLAPSKPVVTQVAMGYENDELVVMEIGRQLPGQMMFDGAAQPEPMRFVVGGKKKSEEIPAQIQEVAENV